MDSALASVALVRSLTPSGFWSTRLRWDQRFSQGRDGVADRTGRRDCALELIDQQISAAPEQLNARALEFGKEGLERGFAGSVQIFPPCGLQHDQAPGLYSRRRMARTEEPAAAAIATGALGDC